jgi:GrpB-like predicted nucleotidyltransferase (UPF0157 family)
MVEGLGDVRRLMTPRGIVRCPERDWRLLQDDRLAGIFHAVAIQVHDYDDRWPALAESACRQLTEALPGILTVIEHIGSTAVPGLAAKAIIDLMAAVPSLGMLAAAEPTLMSLGYQRYATGMPNRLFYFRDAGSRRTHHLHVVTIDTWPSQRAVAEGLSSRPSPGSRAVRRAQAPAAECGRRCRFLHAREDRRHPGADRSRTDRARSAVGSCLGRVDQDSAPRVQTRCRCRRSPLRSSG